jgi:hypothetical protein
MITPNKVVALRDSVLGRLAKILGAGPAPITVLELFNEVGDQFDSTDQFILAMDSLYILNRITIDFESEKVIYAS